MNSELDKKLVEDFPTFFQDRYGSLNNTCMCWGFECGDGWEPLIRKVAEKAEEFNKGKREDEYIIAVQVKEKFAGLRIYITAAPKEIHDLIDEVEKESFKICEYCGSPGKVVGSSWMKTLCKKCEERIKFK